MVALARARATSPRTPRARALAPVPGVSEGSPPSEKDVADDDERDILVGFRRRAPRRGARVARGRTRASPAATNSRSSRSAAASSRCARTWSTARSAGTSPMTTGAFGRARTPPSGLALALRVAARDGAWRGGGDRCSTPCARFPRTKARCPSRRERRRELSALQRRTVRDAARRRARRRTKRNARNASPRRRRRSNRRRSNRRSTRRPRVCFCTTART